MISEHDYDIYLIDIVKFVLKKWRTILLCAVLSGLLCLLYSILSIKTLYTYQTKVYFVSNTVEKTDERRVLEVYLSDPNIYKEISSELGDRSLVVEQVLSRLIVQQDFEGSYIIRYETYRQKERTLLSRLVNKALDKINIKYGEKTVVCGGIIENKTIIKNISSSSLSLKGSIIGALMLAAFWAVLFVVQDRIRDNDFLSQQLDISSVKTIRAKSQLLTEKNIKENKIISFSSFDITSFNNVREYINQIDNEKVLLIEICREKDLQVQQGGSFLNLESKNRKVDYAFLSYDNNNIHRDNAITNENLRKRVKDYSHVFLSILVDEVPVAVAKLITGCNQRILVITLNSTKASFSLEQKKKLDQLGVSYDEALSFEN